MSFTLKVSSLALLDIEDAFFWYEYQKKGLGDEILKCLYEGLDYIISYPLHCEKKYKEVRVKFYSTFPFWNTLPSGRKRSQGSCFFSYEKRSQTMEQKVKRRIIKT